MDLRETVGTDTPLLGVAHLPALPGAPGYDGSREVIRERAVADALALEAGGIDGIVVENFGDAPFYPDDVPKHVVAEMTAVVGAVLRAVDVPVGVNVLRNDVEAALSVAAATGGAFVRANVHTGVQVTDQGTIEGRAHETLRLRERIDADVPILADLAVKHATPLSERPVADLAVETVDRGLADGLLVTGPATGEAVDTSDLDAVVNRRDDTGLDVPVLAGSGVTPETIGDVLAVADGAVVGTTLTVDGETASPVDEDRVRTLVEAASR